MDRTEEYREVAGSSVEFKFVSVGPAKQAISVSLNLKEVLRRLADEKATWDWVRSEKVGVPWGLRDSAGQSSGIEMRVQQLLAGLMPAIDNRPPLIRFSPVKESQLIKDGLPINLYAKANYLQHQELVYKLHKADGKLVRSILEFAGFYATDSHDWNVLWAGCAPQMYHYEGLHEYQKVNHFPGSTELTRKDNLCMNVMKMQERYGKPSFDFLPETFILPSEFADFYDRFDECPEATWIAKPAASSQGKGIFLVENISQVPLEEAYILSRYINNPFLINGLKFDMRIYVLVSGYDPLRIYVYREGLARFASEEYTTKKDSKFSHLTNYSINKKNDHFVQNQDYRKDDIGHKWSLSALFRHLSDVGVDTEFVWSKIYDLVIKTVVSIEEIVVENILELGLNRGNCFDLFGFDVLLDSDLKPWLLEVNLSPSLATDSPLDLYIKGNLIADTFNLVGIRAFDRKKEALSRVKARIRAKRSSNPKAATQKPAIRGRQNRTKDVVREVLEEFQRKGRFICVYPNSGSNVYEQFFVQPREMNRVLFEVLFENGTFGDGGVASEFTSSHTSFANVRNSSFSDCKVKPSPSKDARLRSSISKEKPFCTISPNRVHMAPRQDKIIITGDDILLEYISRLTRALMRLSEDCIHQAWKTSIEGFLSHPVWKGADPRLNGRDSLWQRLEGRFEEMRERQLRMLEVQARQQGAGRSSAQSEKRKEVISNFSSQQLEDMLRASTKNVAREVVMPLLQCEGGGVLTDVLRVDVGEGGVSANQEEEQADGSEVFRRASMEDIGLPQVMKTATKLVFKRPHSTAKSIRV